MKDLKCVFDFQIRICFGTENMNNVYTYTVYVVERVAKSYQMDTGVRLTPRIMDILILWDIRTAHLRTILNKMASTVVNFYQSSASEHGQNNNKHHHNLKYQLCRFIDMYIGKIFWPTAPCQACPLKRDNQQMGDRIGSFSVRFWLH